MLSGYFLVPDIVVGLMIWAMIVTITNIISYSYSRLYHAMCFPYISHLNYFSTIIYPVPPLTELTVYKSPALKFIVAIVEGCGLSSGAEVRFT